MRVLAVLVAATVALPSFPRSYVGMTARALQADSSYGSRLLGGLKAELSAVAALRTPEAVRAHLEEAVGPVPAARSRLETGWLDPEQASALLVANALSRPEQFVEIVDGLERLRPHGIGSRVAELFASADGAGHPALIAQLRAAGRRKPASPYFSYGTDALWNRFFDGRAGGLVIEREAVSAMDYTGYGPDGRLYRRSGLKKPLASP